MDPPGVPDLVDPAMPDLVDPPVPPDEGSPHGKRRSQTRQLQAQAELSHLGAEAGEHEACPAWVKENVLIIPQLISER